MAKRRKMSQKEEVEMGFVEYKTLEDFENAVINGNYDDVDDDHFEETLTNLKDEIDCLWYDE